MIRVVLKVLSIEDSTQKELHEVDATGTLSAGDKSLADLRKRKLVVQKSGTLSSLLWLPLLIVMQESSMVLRPEGTKFQHLDRKARDRSHCGDANIVRAPFPHSNLP